MPMPTSAQEMSLTAKPFLTWLKLVHTVGAPLPAAALAGGCGGGLDESGEANPDLFSGRSVAVWVKPSLTGLAAVSRDDRGSRTQQAVATPPASLDAALAVVLMAAMSPDWLPLGLCGCATADPPTSAGEWRPGRFVRPRPRSADGAD